jgi:hypothetical protein
VAVVTLDGGGDDVAVVTWAVVTKTVVVTTRVTNTMVRTTCPSTW